MLQRLPTNIRGFYSKTYVLAADGVLLIGSISVIFAIFALIGAAEIAGEVLLIGFTKFAPALGARLSNENINDDDGGLLGVALAPPKIDDVGGAATGDIGDEIIGAAKVLAGSVDFRGVDCTTVVCAGAG